VKRRHLIRLIAGGVSKPVKSLLLKSDRVFRALDLEHTFPLFSFPVEGGVAKTARRLPAKQIIGSAILSAASNLFGRRSFVRGLAWRMVDRRPNRRTVVNEVARWTWAQLGRVVHPLG